MASITSPKGVLGKYAYLTEPDTKFNVDGEYKASLVVPLDDAQALIEKLKAAYEEAYKAECVSKNKKSLKRADMPWEIDEDEGTVTFKFKLKAKIESKRKGKTIVRRVKLFDAKGKLIPNPKSLRIGGGTVAKVAFQNYFWFSPSVGFGLQLQIEAVQIINLVEFGEDRDYGFGEEDGSFDADDVEGGEFEEESYEEDDGDVDEGDF